MAKKSSKRDLKKKYLKQFKTSIGISFFLFLYIGFLLGACYNTLQTSDIVIGNVQNTPTMIDVFTNIIPYIVNTPINLIRILPSNILYIIVAMCAWLIYGLFEYDVFRRKYNTMNVDAHGSGGFNDDLEEFYRNYVVDPKLVGGRTQKNIEGKKITTKKIIVGDTKKPLIPYNVLSKRKLEECLMNSQIYSSEVYLSMNAQWTRRNLNAFYLGASGTGKSRFAVKPNLIQANSSFVVTDPSGEILKDCGGFLKSKGYHIRVLNLKDLTQSNRYNPMAYIEKSSDIPVLTNCLIANLEGKKSQNGGDKFWKDSTLALLTACTAYQFEVFCEENEFIENEKGEPIDENGNVIDREVEEWKTLAIPNPYYKGKRNYINVMRMLRMLDIHEDEGESISDLDRLFAELAEKDPRSYAVSMYRTFKMAPSKTALNIVISTAVQIGTFFDNHEFANMAYKDEMNIDLIGKEKTAVFIITPEGETTYNFFAAMFYTQLFQVLYAQGEKNASLKGGDPALDVPVRVFLDEMANIGQVPQFNEKLATMRKYRISAVPIFQSLAQLKTCFEKDWEVVIGNCDTMVFLGGAEPSECEMLSKRLGKMSVKTFSYGKNYGSKGGSSDNQQQIGREVLTADEIERMGNHEQLVFLRGERPFCTPKYSYEDHPNYKYTAGSGCKEAIKFDMESLDIAIEYNDMEKTYLFPYGDEKHVEPKQNQDCINLPLPVDNFSIQLDKRTQTISGGKIKKWKDTVVIQTEKKENFIIPSEEAVKQFMPLNDSDKKDIERKLEDITGKKYINISEIQFKQLANLSPDATTEQIMEWCAEHLQIGSGFSPDYEFSAEEDFILMDNNSTNEFAEMSFVEDQNTIPNEISKEEDDNPENFINEENTVENSMEEYSWSDMLSDIE